MLKIPRVSVLAFVVIALGAWSAPSALAQDAPAMTLSSITPAAGPTSGGTVVTIVGANFQLYGQPVTSVTFGTTLATGVVVNTAGTTLTVIAPAHAAGLVDIVVYRPLVTRPIPRFGEDTSTATFTGVYTYAPPPVLTAVVPASGLVAGGASVVVSGAGLLGASAVSFGGVAGSSVVVVSDSAVSVVVPAHAAGVVDVVVTTAGGAGLLAGSFTYVEPFVLVWTRGAAALTGGGSGGLPPTPSTALQTLVTAPSAGTFSQSGQLAGGARSTRALRVCSGVKVVRKAGRVSLTCVLTAQAWALLHRRALRVVVTTSFTPAGVGVESSASRTVLLRRVVAAPEAVTG